MGEVIFQIEKENGVLIDKLYTGRLNKLSPPELEQMMEKGEYLIEESMEALKGKQDGQD